MHHVQCYKTTCRLAEKKTNETEKQLHHVIIKKQKTWRTEGLGIAWRESLGQPAGVGSSNSSCVPLFNNISIKENAVSRETSPIHNKPLGCSLKTL